MKKLILATVLLTVVSLAQAQEKLGKKILTNTKEKAKSKTEQEADKTVDKALDKVATGIGSIFKKKDKSDTSKGGTQNNTGSGTTTTSGDVGST